jgi:ferredoxin/flavodoxin
VRGAIIYFSGTGNTEFAAKIFKEKFQEKDIECSMIDISKKRNLTNEYDFYVFGGPIYKNLFPENFIDWVKNKVTNGENKKCIVFSTQSESGLIDENEVSKILVDKGFEVLIEDTIPMPNSYYIEKSNRITENEIATFKEKARQRIEILVGKFLSEEKYKSSIIKETQSIEEKLKKTYCGIGKNWAQKHLSVNYDLCVKCGKCAKNCPLGNISMKEEITFREKCISCQKCIHRCPVNAFLYNGDSVDQYKL